MTLPRHHSRLITVDDRVFRWKPSPMRGYSTPKMGFLCHEESEPSKSTLKLTMWEEHCPVITPAVAESLIRGAMKHGWDPLSRGLHIIGPKIALTFLGSLA